VSDIATGEEKNTGTAIATIAAKETVAPILSINRSVNAYREVADVINGKSKNAGRAVGTVLAAE
jgi:hypothetical protein